LLLVPCQKFHRDLPPTRVFAYGASKAAATVPGPTIEAMQGVPTYVTWTNHLPARHILPWDRTVPSAVAKTGGGVPTVVHLHGGVQHSTSDGHSLAWFTSGFAAKGPHFSSPRYAYPNRQPPGNLWYHDHAMGLTRVNILAGLMGAYRVASPDEEGPLNLPSGAAFDRNLVLFDRDFLAADGSLFMNRTGNNPDVHPQWQPEYFGAVVVVNGKAWPYLRVRRRRYRFRVLNASNARFFRLSLSGGLRFVHVSSDSVYLARPVPTDAFLVAPSEIADVVVDFAATTVGAAFLSDDAPAPYPGDKAEKVAVMKFVIEGGGPDENDPSTVPATLMPHYPRPDPREATLTRHITMYEYTKNGTDEPTHLYLNALSYMDPVTETPREGSSEIWDVINLTDDNHPLHVHLAVFAVLEQRSLRRVDEFKDCMTRRNDARACGIERHLAGGKRHVAPRQERGWKNVFKVRPGAVTRLLVRFKPLTAVSAPPSESRFDFDVTTGPGYVYHCHVSTRIIELTFYFEGNWCL
jgi:FtsP/CotA-like multicopper oxidase with cupredoxin domain